MAELDYATTIPSDADTIIAAISGQPTAPVLQGIPDELADGLLTAAQLLGASPTAKTPTMLPVAGRRIVLVGLGEQPSVKSVTKAFGAGVRAVIELDDVRRIALSPGITDTNLLRAAVEGALMAGIRSLPITSQEEQPPRHTIVVVCDEELQATAYLAGVIANAVGTVRNLVNTPPNLLTPSDMVSEADNLIAKYDSVTMEIMKKNSLGKGGFGGILAVGGGSDNPPRLITLRYEPAKPVTPQAHIALIGKGITFDSGGIDLKPVESMVTMKGDMAGAACVLAAICGAAELELPVQITGWLAMAENMPGGGAYRPSDVLTMRNGMTVENYNTDAEGRLVMADALARAAEDTPDLLLDIATLTGAKMIALGTEPIGLFTSDDALTERIVTAAADAGELAWPLPITDEAEETIKSDIADVRSGGSRFGGALIAAAFLKRFTAGLPWVHLDIAASEWNPNAAHDFVPKGATGYGVRTLLAVLRSYAGDVKGETH
ncbi:MAG: leucyl aminopeptidase [Propionibacteriaceae bacterium]|jgi:leucyl aminopeptidase|nr:leucyl aminopeptidase [Propionibacteriaceae bacterium]